MTQYKLDPDKINTFAFKENVRGLRLVVLAFITATILQLSYLKRELEVESFSGIFLPYLVTLLFLVIVFFMKKKYTTLVAENLIIIIDSNYIMKKIDLENEPRMNAIYTYLYNRAKRVYGYNSCIEFEKIKSIEYKKGDLWIFSIDSNSFTGRNILIVPKEIEGFAQVELIIKQQLK